MSNGEFINKDDCEILRGEEAKAVFPHRSNGMAKLVDIEDRELIFQFPDDWTDEQIWHALLFVNTKYGTCFEHGVLAARKQFRSCIGIGN